MTARPTPSATELGSVVRAERTSQALTQVDLSVVAGVSPVFIHNLEHGKPTVRLDAVLRVLGALGLALAVIGGTSDRDA